MKIYITLFAMLVSFVSGLFVCKMVTQKKSNQVVESTVMLEKLRNVFKIAVIESDYSELITVKDHFWVDISPFRKQAIIRVKATVMAGVNMDSSSVNIFEKEKKIVLSFQSMPDILSIDHQIDYYDLQQGTFNQFTPEEMTKLQTFAKDKIRSTAISSGLLNKAEKRRDEMLQQLELLFKSSGWKLEVVKVQPQYYKG